MTKNRNRESILILAFSGYFAVSMVLTTVILLVSLAAVKFLFLLAGFVLGPERIYWLKPAIHAAGGFAIASALSVLAQYLLVSFMSFSGVGRRWIAGALFYTSLFCGLFFWRFAALSELGAYPLSGLPVMLAAILGGAAALTDKNGENPWPESFSRFFQ